MKIQYRLRFGDLIAFNAFHKLRSSSLYITFLGYVIFTSYFVFVLPDNEYDNAVIYFMAQIILEACFILVYIIIYLALLLLALISRNNRKILTDTAVTITEEGVEEKSHNIKAEFKWATIERIRRSANHIFIYINTTAAIIVPRRAFPDHATWIDFFNYCDENIRSAG